jgi:hypothetical protein
LKIIEAHMLGCGGKDAENSPEAPFSAAFIIGFGARRPSCSISDTARVPFVFRLAAYFSCTGNYLGKV